MKQYTGFVFACFSISSLTGALLYGAKNWTIPLWKRFYVCLAVLSIGIGSFRFARHLWVIMVIYLIIGVCQRRRGSTATSSCCISCRRPASPRAWRGWAQ